MLPCMSGAIFKTIFSLHQDYSFVQMIQEQMFTLFFMVRNNGFVSYMAQICLGSNIVFKLSVTLPMNIYNKYKSEFNL